MPCWQGSGHGSPRTLARVPCHKQPHWPYRTRGRGLRAIPLVAMPGTFGHSHLITGCPFTCGPPCSTLLRLAPRTSCDLRSLARSGSVPSLVLTPLLGAPPAAQVLHGDAGEQQHDGPPGHRALLLVVGALGVGWIRRAPGNARAPPSAGEECCGGLEREDQRWGSWEAARGRGHGFRYGQLLPGERSSLTGTKRLC